MCVCFLQVFLAEIQSRRESSPLRHSCDQFLHQRSWIYKTIYRIHPWGWEMNGNDVWEDKHTFPFWKGVSTDPAGLFCRGELLELSFLCVFSPTKSSYWTKIFVNRSLPSTMVADDFYSSNITNLSHQFVPQFASYDSVKVSYRIDA